jgi:acyl-coenzyme A thioesterase PaaI-like protein
MLMDREALAAFLGRDVPEVAGGFRVRRADPAGVALALAPAAQHRRPGGTVSGPTLFALADVTVYLAILSRIGPKALTVSTGASIDFLRRPPAGRGLVAEARLLKRGRRLAVGDALVVSEGADGPVARATLTYSVPPDP